MGIILVAPAVVTPIVAGGAGAAVAGFAAKLLATTAISTALSFAAGQLQPKASTSGGDTAGRMISVSNTGVDPRIVILGRFRDAGSLVWHTEYGDESKNVMQIIQVCDLPVEGFLTEIVDGAIEPLISNNSQSVRGHTGVGFNDIGDPLPLDANDMVPLVTDGAPGDFWRQTPTVPGQGPLWHLNGNRPEELTGAAFHDLPSSDPTIGLGSNKDIAVNRATGDVFWKRGGHWRKRAKTSATAGPTDKRLIESAGEPGDENDGRKHFSRYLHWENGDERWAWHFKVRYKDGTQTVVDSYAKGISDIDGNSEWTTAAVGFSRAYKVVNQKYYPSVYPGSFPVQTASIMLGVKVFDPRRAATGTDVNWYGTTVKSNQIAWTENAALIAAFIKCWPELPGAVPYSEIDQTELIASANVCDEVVTNPDSSTEPRYTINGMVQSTESRDSVEEALEIALGGHIFRRGGKWVIWAGRDRAVTASFDALNIVGNDYEYQPAAGLRERKNRVIGTWFHPNQNFAQQSMQPVKVASYITADGGNELTESIHFRFAARSRFTPRRLALLWLHQRRAEANTLSIKLDVEALDLSPLDVIELTDNVLGFLDTRFVVAALSSPYLSALSGGGDDGAPAVQCTFFAYNPNTWDAPTEDPTEPDFTLPKVRDLQFVDPPASIAVSRVLQRAALDVSGETLANVTLEIGRSPHERAVDYEVQYRMAGENFTLLSGQWGDGSEYAEEREWTSLIKVPNPERSLFTVQIKSLYDNAYYDFRVRALNNVGGASDPYTDNDWTRQIDAYFVETGATGLPGPPGSNLLGDNLIPNGNFEGGLGINTGIPWGWEYQTTSPALFSLHSAGGKFGPHRLQIIMNGTTDNQYFRTNRRGDLGGLIQVQEGERYEFVWWIEPAFALVGDDPVNAIIQVQFYGPNGKTQFLQTDVVATRQLTFLDEGEFRRVRGNFTVPAGMSFMRPQYRHDPTGATSGATFMWSDGLKVKRVVGGTSTLLRSTVSLNVGGGGDATVWTSMRAVEGANPGDPVRIQGGCQARVGDSGTAGSNSQMMVRVVRTTLAGTGLVVIQAEENVGDAVAPGSSWGEGWFTVPVDVVDSTGDRGAWIYRIQARCSNVNGQLQMRDRVVAWSLDEASAQS